MDLQVFFANEVKPAMGCTEPVAVALATAEAAKHMIGKLESIHLVISLNIYKNGRCVGIPGTNGLRGNRVAAVLGALAGDPAKGLMVLENTTPEHAAQAKELVDAGKITVDVAQQGPAIMIDATVRTSDGECRVVIRDRHDAVYSVELNGKSIFHADESEFAKTAQEPAYLAELKQQNIKNLWDMAGSLDASLEAFMLKGVEMNMSVAEKGLEGGQWGLGVGLSMKEHSRNDDVLSTIKCYAGAASDVRMSGAPFAVMSSAGSGNHGITAIIPLAVLARSRNTPARDLAEAVAFSHLVTGYVKAFTGRLTPICGCSVAAGAGAAAGMVRILGGTPAQAERAVASLISSLMGMLCDGAKGSCGLKVSAAAGEAYAAALMAMDDRGVQHTEGLVSPNLHNTAQALGDLCLKAFANSDAVMVEILRKQPLE